MFRGPVDDYPKIRALRLINRTELMPQRTQRFSLLSWRSKLGDVQNHLLLHFRILLDHKPALCLLKTARLKWHVPA